MRLRKDTVFARKANAAGDGVDGDLGAEYQGWLAVNRGDNASAGFVNGLFGGEVLGITTAVFLKQGVALSTFKALVADNDQSGVEGFSGSENNVLQFKGYGFIGDLHEAFILALGRFLLCFR